MSRRGIPPTQERVIETRATMPDAGGGIQVEGDGGTLTGYAAVFGQWTEINSVAEGRFQEQVAPGAFAKTIRDRGDRIRVLLEHGHDGRIGNRPLGKLVSLAEDDYGLAYRVKLFTDAPYVSELLPALGAGLYGSSFRFAAIRENFDPQPGRTPDNPMGLPRRTLEEVRLHELGPCTFPAYPAATATLRDHDQPTEEAEMNDALARELAERKRTLLEMELIERRRTLWECGVISSDDYFGESDATYLRRVIRPADETRSVTTRIDRGEHHETTRARTTKGETLVATESRTIDGIAVVAGITRIAAEHPWAAQSGFAALGSPAGKAAVSRRSAGARAAQVELWFAKPAKEAWRAAR